MKYLVFILMLTCVLTCFSQNYIPYYNKTSEAEWFFDNGKYDEAQVVFDEAFKMVKTPKTKDIWLYAIILFKQNKNNKAYRLLKNHVKAIGGVQTSIAPFLEKDNIYLKPNQIKKIDSYMIDTLKNERYVSEKEVYDFVYGMRIQDQLIRKKDAGWDSIWWKEGNDSVFVERKEKMKEIDSIHFEKIKKLFEQGKLQTNRLLDVYFCTLLLHIGFENFQKIEPYLLEMVKTGYFDPWDFARIKEKAIIDSCPIYFVGLFSKFDVTCISYETILENRKSIGLSTYYSRPSFHYYIKPGYAMKEPFRTFYESKISQKSNL